jgi:hypothetical protein
MDVLHGVLENEPVHCDQGDAWIVRPKEDIVPGRNFRD